jgi:small subunit ribosomal protein S5
VEGPNKHLYSDPIYSAVAAPIPKIHDPRVQYPTIDDDATTLGLQRVSQQTGYSVKELRQFRTKQLLLNRVANQTRKGKIYSLYAITVAGNGDGLVGIGEGKAFEAEDAINKSKLRALRNVMPVPRYEKRTIFGELHSKVGGCTVHLMSRPPGMFPCFLSLFCLVTIR